MVAIAKEKIVLDVGGGDRFTKWLGEYKSLFKDCDYKTMDSDNSTGADIVGDIHDIPLKENSIDALICSSVLEHVSDPIVAIREIHRILRPGGKLFVFIPSVYPYHARKGHYPDYWRFFGDTINLLFKDFNNVEVVKRGGYFKAMSLFVPEQHRFRTILDYLSDFLDNIFNTVNRKNTTSGYYIFAIK